MGFEFRRAERDKTGVLLALAGASGSGKTYTAIMLALGLAYPDMTPEQILATIDKERRARVALIDTENGRALHYAPKPGQRPDFKSSFPFEYAEIKPPFTPQAYKEAVVTGDEAGFAALIVDSMSHEYESEGGILEWADQLAEGVPKPGVTNPEPWKREHWISQPVKSPGNWKEPKREHKKMVNRMLQCKCHLIFCLRAEEKMKLLQEKDDRGKVTVKVIAASDRPLKERWEPICEKRFMYEMTASFILLPSDPGVGIPIKLQEQHQSCFPEGERIGAKSGQCLAAWATGDSSAAPSAAAAADKPEAENTAAPKSDDAAGAAAEWAKGYIAKVVNCSTLDSYAILQDEFKAQLERIKSAYPALWNEINFAHGSAYDRLSGNQDDSTGSDTLFGDSP